MAKEITLEEAILTIESQKKVISDLTNKVKELNKEIKSTKDESASLKNEVPGTFVFESEEEDDANLVGEYRFKKGHLKVSYKGQTLESVKALEDKVFMSELVKIGAGCIEKVESK